MCIFNSKQKAQGPTQAERDAQAAAARNEQLVNEQRLVLQRQQSELTNSQKAFQETQNAYVARLEAMQQQAADREAAQYNAVANSNLPALIQANTDTTDPGSSESNLLDSQRRGRRALRIDLQAPSTGTSGSGLNVPRG